MDLEPTLLVEPQQQQMPLEIHLPTLSFTLVKNDVTKPTISVTVNNSSPQVTTSSQSTTVTYTLTATDNVGISSYSVGGATYSSKSK